MVKKIGNAELIINPDGSIYHLCLRPEDLAQTLIIVGDIGRVKKISRHFDKIEVEKQNRDFMTHTGTIGKKRITVLSSGIGTDNIDIVMGELDALVNIDLETREPRAVHTSLDVIRLGTSGALQPDIDVDSFVVSSYGLGLDGLIHFYELGKEVEDLAMSAAFVKETQWPSDLSRPYFVKASEDLMNRVGKGWIPGITATSPGFYGPQGRVLRLQPFDHQFVEKMTAFEYEGQRVVNFEMETSALFGLSRMMGHQAITVCVAVANRPKNTFSKDYTIPVDKLIIQLLERLSG